MRVVGWLVGWVPAWAGRGARRDRLRFVRFGNGSAEEGMETERERGQYLSSFVCYTRRLAGGYVFCRALYLSLAFCSRRLRLWVLDLLPGPTVQSGSNN